METTRFVKRHWKLFLLIPLAAALFVFSSNFDGGGAPERPRPWSSEAGGASGGLPSMLQVTGMLAGVLLIAVGGLYLIRRFQGGFRIDENREIRIKESKRISPKRVLHLVRAGDRLLLLAESEHGLQLLTDMTPEGGEHSTQSLEEAPPPARTLPPPERDEGAVPRDMILPRPQGRSRRRPRSVGSFRELMSRMGS